MKGLDSFLYYKNGNENQKNLKNIFDNLDQYLENNSINYVGRVEPYEVEEI